MAQFKRTLFAAAATASLLLPPVAALADGADVIVERMQLESQFMDGIQPILPMMSDQMVAKMRESGMTVIGRIERDGKGGLPRFKEIIREEFLTAVQEQMPQFEEDMAGLLREELTAKELKKIEKFVKTDAGAKFFSVVYGSAQAKMQGFGERIGATAGSTALTRALERAEEEQF